MTPPLPALPDWVKRYQTISLKLFLSALGAWSTRVMQLWQHSFYQMHDVARLLRACKVDVQQMHTVAAEVLSTIMDAARWEVDGRVRFPQVGRMPLGCTDIDTSKQIF